MDAQVILAKIQNYLQKANVGAPGMSEEIIEEAAEKFKETLRKTFNETYSEKFRIRMSNAGRPSCQLQMERDGVAKEAQPYSFRLKMLIGDTTETILRAVIRASGVPVESANEKVELKLDDNITIRGELDLDIDGIWDVKSASNWSFQNKWNHFSDIEKDDPFGYAAQLYGYAEAKGRKARGWIVMNKETGDLKIVEAVDTPENRKKQLDRLRENIYKVVDLEVPFQRSFQDEEETFYKVPTGNRKLGITCGYCVYKWNCWEGLKVKPQVKSTSSSPKLIYYSVYDPASEKPHEVKEKVEKKSTRRKSGGD